MSKAVGKDEFDAFIAAYPRPLDINVSGISEPPTKSYNDFTLGNWPESVVASVSLFEIYPKGDPKSYPYVWEPNKYRIHREPGSDDE